MCNCRIGDRHYGRKLLVFLNVDVPEVNLHQVLQGGVPQNKYWGSVLRVSRSQPGVDHSKSMNRCHLATVSGFPL